jgi:hypothetical protein
MPQLPPHPPSLLSLSLPQPLPQQRSKLFMFFLPVVFFRPAAINKPVKIQAIGAIAAGSFDCEKANYLDCLKRLHRAQA